MDLLQQGLDMVQQLLGGGEAQGAEGAGGEEDPMALFQAMAQAQTPEEIDQIREQLQQTVGQQSPEMGQMIDQLARARMAQLGR